MQVNKYVHPCERIPAYIQQADQDKFKEDYNKKENERIKEHLETFDQMVCQRLLGCKGGLSRIKRFQEEYLPDEGCVGDSEEKLAYVMIIDDL